MPSNAPRAAVPAALASTILASILLAPLAACTFRPASPTRALQTGPALPPVDPSVWPSRDITAMEAIRAATPEVIPTLVPNPAHADPAAAASAAARAGSVSIGVNQIIGQGLFRTALPSEQPLRSRRTQPLPGDRLGSPDAFSGLGLSANALFTTARTIDALRDSGWDRVNLEAWAIVESQLRAAGAPLLPNTQTQRAALDAGVPIHIPEHWPTPTRGILIHFNGLEGTPFERDVIDRLARRGWMVASIDIAKSVHTPRSPEARLGLATLQERVLDAYRLGSVPTDIASGPGGAIIAPATREAVTNATRALSRAAAPSFQLCSMDQVDAVARAIGVEVDQTLAGNAYAAEAVLRNLDAIRLRDQPGSVPLPVVIVGFSAGALAAPTAAVRLGDRVSALVLIGGGTNLFALSQSSTIARGGIVLRCGTEPARPDLVAAVGERYLAETKLDPFHMALQLRDRPVLQIHASLDTWVPAPRGIELWRQLGEPDTIAVPAGHRVLFLTLPLMADRIADWLDANAAKS